MARAMLEEIKEQPNILEELWKTHEQWARPFVELCRAHAFKRVLFVGNGSPYYCGYTLRYAAERFLHANAESVFAAQFNNHGAFDASGSLDPSEILLICPAESGHSKGQVDAARRARALGIPVVCTTLNPTGVLARECDVVLSKRGSGERAVAATKNQTQALFLVLTCLVEAGHALGNIDERAYRTYRDALSAVPANVAETIGRTSSWCADNIGRLMRAGAFFLIGYGSNYGTAQEAALKFYETHERPTYAFDLEETLHGPFRALHRDDFVFFISAEPCPERDRMELLAKETGRYCDNRVIVQSASRDSAPDVLGIATSDIEFVCAIEYLVALQVICEHMSAELGIDLTVPKVSELDPVMLPAYED